MESWLVFVAAALLLATRVRAQEVLDQSFLGDDGSNVNVQGPAAGISTAETFTVGVSGTLSRVVVDVGHSGGAADLSVRILTTTNGVPDSSGNSVLGWVTVPASSVGSTHALLSVPLTGPPIQVTSGEVLAISLSVDTGSETEYPWYGSSAFGPLYAGGRSFQKTGSGLWQPSGNQFGLNWANAFETYVTVPEPVGVGVVSLFALVLRRRR